MSHSSLIRAFSRAAPWYERHADLQKELACRLATRLADPCGEHGQLCNFGPNRVLDVGCGTGFLTRALVERLPDATIDAIDISPGMLQIASEKIASPHVCFVAADIEEYTLAGRFHLIASSSALHWVYRPERLFERFARAQQPGDRLLLSFMIEGTLEELHRVRLEIAPHNPPQQRLPSLERAAAWLRQSGYRLEHQETLRRSVAYDDASSFLNALRVLGFTGGGLSQGRRPLARGELRRIEARYQEQYADSGGRVHATFVIGVIDATRCPDQRAEASHSSDCG